MPYTSRRLYLIMGFLKARLEDGETFTFWDLQDYLTSKHCIISGKRPESSLNGAIRKLEMDIRHELRAKVEVAGMEYSADGRGRGKQVMLVQPLEK